MFNLQRAAWSSPNSISPTFSHVRLGSNSRVCCSNIPNFRGWRSSADERFCHARSILFTNTWGVLEMPCFYGVMGPQILLGVNSDFTPSKNPL